MSPINLKRFVDINITPTFKVASDSTRETVVVFTSELEEFGTKFSEVNLSSMSDVDKILSDKVRFKNSIEYLTVFFSNGGVKAKLIKGVELNELTAERIQALDNEFICIAYVASTMGDQDNTKEVFSKMSTIALELESNTYGINEKMLLCRTKNSENTASIKNLVVKYSSVNGAEMTIAAYLSKINVYKINSIFDYAFTQEVIAEENISDSTFESILNNNMNVDIHLTNAVRNCGGNCKDGQDIVNTFVRIILHQTLTNALINLLSQKIKGEIGLSKIYAVISQELEKYLSSGYLTTDKIWSDESLSIVYNGKEYSIIEQGTPLTNGYEISILPMSSLTESDKRIHKTPPIYIILADQYSIRQIVIDGNII